MTVLLDNIIFGLQPHGGISVYWAEILARAARAGYSWTDPYSPPGNESRASLKDISRCGRHNFYYPKTERD